MSDYEYPSLRQRVQTLVDQIKSTVLLPIRIATSKIAIRTYITSLLFFATSFFLLGLAITAYTAFYWSYIPRIGFTRPIHLQFDDYTHLNSAASTATQPLQGAETTISTVATEGPGGAPHPWGTAILTPDFASQQLYDITVHLTLPRTPQNTAAGNFMLEASLLGPSLLSASALPKLLGGDGGPQVLAKSRRSAILTFYSREVDLARKALRLPGLVTGLSHETESLDVPLFEGVSFPRGWKNVPAAFKLEIQSRERNIQVYSCSVSFKARFRGLRWIMYNHRIASAITFISAFWLTEMIAVAASWVILSFFIFPKVDDLATKSERSGNQSIKQEHEEDGGEESPGTSGVLSDTERTFPSYAGQPVLKYQSSKDEPHRKIKQEKEESTEPFPPLLQHMSEAADDEDEEDDYVLDSGLGTSLESSAGSRGEGGVRRRKSGRGVSEHAFLN